MVSANTNDGQLGWWQPAQSLPATGDHALSSAVHRVTQPFFLINHNGKTAVSQEGTITIGEAKPSGSDVLPLIGYAPALHPKELGDKQFKKSHNLRYAYVVGAMANGITSVEMVEAAGRGGMMGFFGAAGLMPNEIEAAIDHLKQRMGKWSIAAAMFVCTLLFILLHYPAISFIQIVGGLLFAIAYEIEKCLMVPITIHVLGNLALFTLPILLQGFS